tara:strand:+ start:444 stop:686 length:243 start_codon:yes stop_codon:yes gene_type:complete
MREELFKIIKKYAEFNHDFEGEVSGDTKLRDLGIDSLGWQELLMIMEDKFEKEIFIDSIDFENTKTLDDLYHQLEKIINP